MVKKLELVWAGKRDKIKVEPRILVENTNLSNIEKRENTKNIMIHGDNLLALKALEKEYSGKIKCAYIDPPYNISAATEYYDDNFENSQWLNLMKPRIELLWDLLTPDGLLAVQIDDEQFARLFLLMAEICNQKNMKIICVKMSEATGVKMASVNNAGSIAKLKEYIILAKKDGIKNLNVEEIPKDKWDNEYKILIKNVSKEELDILKDIMSNDDISDEAIKKGNEIASKIQLGSISELTNDLNAEEVKQIKYENAWRIARDVAVTGNVKKITDESRDSAKGEAFLIKTVRNKKYLMKRDYNKEAKQPRCKLLFADQYLTVHSGDLWTDIKTTGLDNEGTVNFPKGKKPEKLIERILKLNTKEGDIVLDSFLGSGTTAAVAHKMNRNWIGIEMGNHAYTHCKVRLDNVISGADQGGISKVLKWKGGGGYRFYELAPSIINIDNYGEAIINPEYSPNMLASAVALHEGFTYEPSNDTFWKQSRANENSFLFVTTRHIDKSYLLSLEKTIDENEYLIIACKSYDSNIHAMFKNIKVKKIPEMLLGKCEFGKDNYNLNIINPPIYNDNKEDEEDNNE